MIKKLETKFTNIVSFEFKDSINKEDFEMVVFPAIKALKEQQQDINMVYVLHTKLENFTMQAWVQDALLGLKNITQFNRVAIVTSNDNIKEFTELFSKVIPGDFKGFDLDEVSQAHEWAALGN